MQKIHPRFAHSEGLTKVVFGSDGNLLITAGYDCLIRLFKTVESERDSEAKTLDNQRDSILGLSAGDKHFAVCSEDSTVSLYSYPDAEFVGLLTRTTLPVRSISICPNEKRIAVASDETTIKVVEINDIENVTLLKGHTKSVKSVSWHPSGNLLTSAGCEGVIRVWKIDNDSAECIRTLDGLIPALDSEDDASVQIAWHPNGSYFAAPGRTNDIILVSKDTWSKTRAIATETSVLELSFSPNGVYLATSTLNGLVIIFDVTKRERIAEQKTDSNVTGLSWHPTGNSLAYVNMNGQLMLWDDIIPITDGITGPTDKINFIDNETRATSTREIEPENTKGAENIINDADIDDWIIDDDGAGYVSNQTKTITTEGKTPIEEKISMNIKVNLQKPFQPGATPIKNNRRYLAFNMTGTITSVDQETHNVITLEFHDKSSHRGYHFTDHFQYSMASLGDRGALFAAKSTKDSPSVIYYKPFQTWTNASEWQFSLPLGEEVQAIALGSRGAIIVTSTDFIRFFSHSGVQTYLLCIPQVIAVAAKDDYAFILHHLSAGVGNFPDIGFTIYNLTDFNIIQNGKLPLGQNMQVTWLGFSEEGAPLFYDSIGVLYLLDRFRRASQGRWMPIFTSSLTAKKEVNLIYWPIGCNSTQFFCCILKGVNEKYPYGSKPIIQQVDLQLPLLNMDNQNGQIEEKIIRETMFAQMVEDTFAAIDELEEHREEIARTRLNIDKYILQLIQHACKTEKIARALDLTMTLKNIISIEAACKIAGFFHLPALQERMNLIKESKQLEQEMGDEFSSMKQRLSKDILSSQSNTLFTENTFIRELSTIPQLPTIQYQRDEFQKQESKRECQKQEYQRKELNQDSRIRESSVIPDTQEDDIPSSKQIEQRHLPSNPWLTKKPKISNPFMKNVTKGTSSNISRSNSFFERVDESKPQMQKTLFGTTVVNENSTSTKRSLPNNEDENNGETKKQKPSLKGKERAHSVEALSEVIVNTLETDLQD